MKNNKKLSLSVIAITMLFMTFVCLILRIYEMNKFPASINSIALPTAPKNWAIVALVFAIIAVIILLGSIYSFIKEGYFQNRIGLSLNYSGLILGLISASVTLGQAHDDFTQYNKVADLLSNSGINGVVDISGLKNIALPFIPMTLSSTIQGSIFLACVALDITENSIPSARSHFREQNFSDVSLKDRSFLKNVEETLTFYSRSEELKPVHKKITNDVSRDLKIEKPISKVAEVDFTEEEFQNKLNAELNKKKKIDKLPKKNLDDSFDEAVKKIARAEQLLKMGEITQKEFVEIKNRELLNHR